MKKQKILIALLCITLVALSLAGCGGGSGDDSNSADAKKLSIAYQYGIQYMPMKIVQEQNLIEKYYDGEVDIDWQIMNAGAAISEGMVSGTLDLGFIGPSVAVTGIAQEAPYKIFTGVSAIPNRMMTNDKNIKSLKDIKKDDQVALVNINSIQHIMLAMACKTVLGDAHALDNNILGVSHPDGMQALISESVKAHYTTLPYNYVENKDGMKEITEVYDNVPNDTTIIVGVANNELVEDEPELYEAITKAFKEATEYMSDENNHEEIANSIFEDEGVTKEEMLEMLNSKDAVFSTQIRGFANLIKFMNDEGFLTNKASTDLSVYTFEGVDVK